jgi:hypothetical protein
MHRKPLSGREEVRRRPERVPDDEHAAVHERGDLTPAGQPRDLEAERQPARGHVQRHSEALRDARAVATVAVEQLDDGGRPAERLDTIVEPLHVEDVEEPDPIPLHDRVRGALQVVRLLGLPPEAALELVHDPHGEAG